MPPIDPPVPSACTGVVLAAGAGTRYGKPKALAEDGAWLRAAITALRDGGCDPVIVLLGATGPDPAVVGLPPGTEWRWVADWATGLSATVRAGLRAATAAGTRYVAFLPVDTPDIGADVVARVLAAARASESGLARAVFSDTPGHPAVIENKHWDAISAATVGDVGAGSYLGTSQDMVCVTCDDLATGNDRDFPVVGAR
ncbi:molybdopterin-guanine dinucleotide biosynthesis protein MobA [Nocardia sp. MH4]|uniref:nucleotidyltransferase family protein n=1 Tax=unclassified Nocardia TaxID=2637762 RepID=UPI001C4F0B39|nr:NTP transferase domain-containing protein [Nocardia sp. MH4]MBW0275645.1 molybdopterin-guanine dinucleotide biosynthesis protein MobA [Nocardia sp. MH4]